MKKKTVKRKLTLSKETLAHLEKGQLEDVAGGVFVQGEKLSDNWEKTTCM